MMRAVATDKLSLKALPDRARDYHKFSDITLPLVSVPQLCDSNMDVLFAKTSVTVTNATGDTVLEGHRDPFRNLYMVPLENSPPPTRVVSAMIDDPIVLSRHTASNAYEIKAVTVLVSYFHAAAGFPAKGTWLRVVEANLFSTCMDRDIPTTGATPLNRTRTNDIRASQIDPKEHPFDKTETDSRTRTISALKYRP